MFSRESRFVHTFPVGGVIQERRDLNHCELKELGHIIEHGEHNHWYDKSSGGIHMPARREKSGVNRENGLELALSKNPNSFESSTSDTLLDLLAGS